MGRTMTLALLAMMVFVSVLIPAAAPAGQVIQGAEVEEFLKKARFIAREDLGSGVTKSYKVTLQQGNDTRFAVLKTVDQKRPGALPNAKGEIELDFQDSWKTEVAAYEFDKLIGLGMVPATIERKSPYDNKPASLQLWVNAAMSEAKRRERAVIPPSPDSWARQLSDMALFDALIYNTDRHPDNLLITEDFQVRLIDHSRSFRPNTELRNGDELMRFSRTLIAKLETLSKSNVERRLGDFLSLQQMNGLMKRRDLIVARAKELARQYGENAVYY
jgi:hypothetical protein